MGWVKDAWNANIKRVFEKLRQYVSADFEEFKGLPDDEGKLRRDQFEIRQEEDVIIISDAGDAGVLQELVFRRTEDGVIVERWARVAQAANPRIQEEITYVLKVVENIPVFEVDGTQRAVGTMSEFYLSTFLAGYK